MALLSVWDAEGRHEGKREPLASGEQAQLCNCLEMKEPFDGGC